MLSEPQLNAAFMPQSVSALEEPPKVYRDSGQAETESKMGAKRSNWVASESRHLQAGPT